jgi:ABC-type spermidine/putrescine transport system permease subunit I
MTLPLLALLLLGFAFPLVRAVRDSVGAKTGDRPYADLAGDRAFWQVLRRTIETGAVVSIICLIVGYPTAEFIAGAPPHVGPILLGMVVVPFWSSVVARTYGWYGVFVKDGPVDAIAHLLGGGNQMLLYSRTAVIVGMVHVLLPILVLAVYAAVRNYDARLSLASFSLGAGRLRTLFLVKLPVLAPSILAATTGVFVLALGFFVTPALLGGSESQLMSTLVSQQVLLRYDLPRAEAMSVVLLLAALSTLALAGAIYALLRRRLR